MSAVTRSEDRSSVSSDSKGSEYSQMLRWMTSFGFEVDKCYLKPSEFKETGRGLAATKNIHPGDLIIEVPSVLIITSRTVMDSYLKHSITRSRLTPLAALCVFLACERRRSSSSPWHNYLATLPSTYTVPVTWPSDLVARLPTAIQKPVQEQRNAVLQLYRRCKQVLKDVGQFCSELKGVEIDAKDFTWAWCTVNTRCVYWLQKPTPNLEQDSEDHYALVPLLDLLNHSHEAQVEAGYCESSNSYRIVTNTGYSVGQQVFINYGPHSNMKLLLEYGFILENNPNDAVHITEDDLLQALEDKQDDEFWSFIHKNDLHKGHALSAEGPTWSLLTALKIAALESTSDKHTYKDRLQDCMEEDQYISEFHRKATRSTLSKLLNYKLEQFQFEIQNPGNPLEQLINKLCADYQHIVRSCFSCILSNKAM